MRPLILAACLAVMAATQQACERDPPGTPKPKVAVVLAEQEAHSP